MAKEMRFFFDKEGDILDISIGEPRKAVSKETEDEIIMRVDPKTNEVVGFTILNFSKRKEFRIPATPTSIRNR